MFFVSSDSHFGHSNIIRYCNRPFASVDEMDAALIANWNNKVGPNDTIYFLGDFTFAKDRNRTREYFDALNGVKHLIEGNHDHKATLELPWASIQKYITVSDFNKMFVMFHYPIRSWNRKNHGAIHLYGHVHSLKGYTPYDPCAIDVGVDANDYTPLSSKDLLDIVEKRQADSAVE